MKNILVLLSTFFAFTFISCNSNTNQDALDDLIIDAKWIIEDSNTYESFEFNNSGDYIVILNMNNMTQSTLASDVASSDDILTRSDASSIIVGTYVSNGDNAVIMDGFGEVEIVTSDSESVSFNLTLEGETEAVTLYSTVAETVSTSYETELLCRKWNFVGFSIDGEEYDMNTNEDGYGFPSSILFSKAGTYLVTYSNEEISNAIIQWKWKSEDTGTFYYAKDGYWSENEYATITTLTSTKLVVSEALNGSASASTFEAAN